RGVSDAELAKQAKVPPWKMRSLRQQARGWSTAGLTRAMAVVAETDALIKGAGLDPEYALERAVIESARARGAGTTRRRAQRFCRPVGHVRVFSPMAQANVPSWSASYWIRSAGPVRTGARARRVWTLLWVAFCLVVQLGPGRRSPGSVLSQGQTVLGTYSSSFAASAFGTKAWMVVPSPVCSSLSTRPSS